jgi:hypothetical protein
VSDRWLEEEVWAEGAQVVDIGEHGEAWVRDMGVGATAAQWKKGKSGSSKESLNLGLVKWWVDHERRIVALESSSAERRALQEDGKRLHIAYLRGSTDTAQGLDAEYRYWSFVDTHPAHITLPSGVTTEATDILSWSHSGQVLPGASAAPPFSTEECQELKGLLNSHPEGLVRTRVLARIMLRTGKFVVMSRRSSSHCIYSGVASSQPTPEPTATSGRTPQPRSSGTEPILVQPGYTRCRYWRGLSGHTFSFS